MAKKTRETINIMQACERCGVSRRTIYNWLRDHRIEYVRTAGGNVRIFTDTLFVRGNVAAKDDIVAAPQPA